MRKILLALVLVSPIAYGATVEGNIITLTDEEVMKCQSNGGCLVIPKDKLDAYMQYLVQMTIEKQQAICIKGKV